MASSSTPPPPLPSPRSRVNQLGGEVDSQRLQLKELDHARHDLSRETQALLSRALHAEEQVSGMLRQVEDLGSQLHLRQLEEETRAAGNWARYVSRN